MSNNYARLLDLKAEVKGAGAPTTDDAALLRVGERATEITDDFCNRHFFAEIATHLYDGNGRAQLWLPDDLVTATTLKVDADGDGVFELTLAANTDYWLWPDGGPPYLRIDLNPRSTALSAFPAARRSVQLAALFGYSYELEATGIAGTLSDASDTSLTANADASALVSPGDTLVIESEQLYVTAVVTTTITVVRGMNGTTAAAHTTQAISRRRYPRPVEQATVMQAARLFRETQTGYGGQIGNQELAGYAFRSMYPAIRDALAPYRVPVVAGTGVA